MGLDSSKALNEAFAVTRTIPVASAGPGQLEHAIERLECLEPVAYAKAGANGLEVCYDASRLGFREIEQLLAEAGIGRPNGLGWRLRAAWYAFVDENARSNARRGDGACCNRPPGPGVGNRS